MSHIKIKLKPLPPKTRRYCLCCEKERLFEYERAIGHSCCTECGGRYSRLMVRKCKECKQILLRKDKRTLQCESCKKEYGIW
jgi:hypothetical protein